MSASSSRWAKARRCASRLTVWRSRGSTVMTSRLPDLEAWPAINHGESDDGAGDGEFAGDASTASDDAGAGDQEVAEGPVIESTCYPAWPPGTPHENGTCGWFTVASGRQSSLLDVVRSTFALGAQFDSHAAIERAFKAMYAPGHPLRLQSESWNGVLRSWRIYCHPRTCGTKTSNCTNVRLKQVPDSPGSPW